MTSDKFEDHGGKQYDVKNYINCQSTNVVYAVFYKKCTNYVYVGETADTLYQHQLLSLSRIKTKYDNPVAIHFYTDGHTIQDFSVMGLERLHSDEQYRKTTENLLKVILSTYQPPSSSIYYPGEFSPLAGVGQSFHHSPPTLPISLDW